MTVRVTWVSGGL